MASRFVAAVLAIAFASIGARAGAQGCVPEWSDQFSHTIASSANGEVRASVVFDDGSGPALYVGGDFTTIGGVAANRIAKWNGATWAPLGSGLTNTVYALTVYNGDLIAGGSFTGAGSTSASRIAKWTGSTWESLGSGVDSTVYAFAVFNGDLIVGGSFSSPSIGVARWNGSTWAAGFFGVSSSVKALAVFDGALIAGGYVNYSEGNVVRWNGSTWSTLGGGVSLGSDVVLSLATVNGALIAAGTFSFAGSGPASRIASWNGSSWSPLGSGMNNEVDSLTSFNGELIAGGAFTTAGGVTATRIARWNGSTWSPLGTGASATVYALTVFEDTLVAGGSRWDGAGWFGFASGNGTSGTIGSFKSATTEAGARLIAIGSFDLVGPVASRRVGQWNGSSWDSLAGGLASGDVRALTTFDDGGGGGPALFIGGSFSGVGGVSALNVAKWNGTNWSPLSTGKNSPVHALAVYDDGLGGGPMLYAAGDFDIAGGVAVNRIARWDGQEWQFLGELGGGVGSAVVNAMVVFDDGGGPALYVGGAFLSAGGDPTIQYLARWNGLGWSSVQGGVNGPVTGLDVLEDLEGQALYVRGTFSSVAGVAGRRIARYGSGGWNRLAQGLEGGTTTVNALAVFDDGTGPRLFVTGSFLSIGGVTTERIARWDGGAWTRLGSIGLLNGSGNALAVYDDGSGPALYVGGAFTEAGGLAAKNIARWDGTRWSVLDIGIRGGTGTTVVNALAVFDGGDGPKLYAGGSFASAGPHPSANLARWDGCPVALLPGDANGDGVVNFIDLNIVLSQFGLSGSTLQGDLNDDGRVDFIDLNIVLSNFGQGR